MPVDKSQLYLQQKNIPDLFQVSILFIYYRALIHIKYALIKALKTVKYGMNEKMQVAHAHILHVS